MKRRSPCILPLSLALSSPLLSSVGRPFLIALEGQTSEQREIEGDGVRRRVRVRARAYVRPGVNMP